MRNKISGAYSGCGDAMWGSSVVGFGVGVGVGMGMDEDIERRAKRLGET